MGRLCSRVEGTGRALTAVVITMSLLLSVAVAPASAEVPPEQLKVLCVDREDKVVQATSPADCTRREVAIQVPQTRPVHLCARDDFGLMRYTTDPGACTRDHEFPLTIPDSGPQILCSKNLKNGRVQSRGTELRWAANAAGCDSKFYTPFVTPAAPEANDDAYTVDEDSVLTVAARGVLDNDADVTGGELTARLVEGTTEGVLALAADGSLSFDPRGRFDDLDADQSRDVTFTYAVSDGELESAPATARITVTGRNDRPVAAADAFRTDEDTALWVVPPGVLGNDVDAEDHTLTAHVVDRPHAGALVLDEDGSIRYDPDGAFEELGADDEAQVGFTYVARDGSDDSDATPVMVTVAGVNDAPVGVPDTFTTDENTPITITPAEMVGNDTDAEGDALSATDVVAGAPADAFTLHADGTVTLDPTTAFDHLGDSDTGIATFHYSPSDGTATSPPTTVTIRVSGISAPVAVDDSAETDEDTAVTIDILGNDTVARSTVALQQHSTTRGAISFDGVVATYDPTGEFDELAPGQTFIDRFGYTLTNAEGTSREAIVTVVVHGRDDAPVAMDDLYHVDPGVPEDDAAPVLANDIDVDTPLKMQSVLVAPPEHGHLTLHSNGLWVFDPAGELAVGGVEETTFRYRTTDGTSESATAEVVLSVVADGVPVVPDDTVPLFIDDAPADFSYQVWASDPEKEPLTFALDPPSALFAISSTGVMTLRGEMPARGTYPLTVVVTDIQGQTATGTITVDVKARFTPSDETYRAIGNTLLHAGPSAGPGGDDAIALTYSSSVLANDGAQDGTVVIVGAGPLTTALKGRVDLHDDGSFTYRPPRPDPQGDRTGDPCDGGEDSGWDGSLPATDSFEYTVLDTDDGIAATQTATLTIVDAVWYVDAAADHPGCGTSEHPYASLAAVSAPGDDDTSGHAIFLRDRGAPYPGGVVLEDDQRLWGEGEALTVDGVTLLDAGAAPVIQGPAGGPAVALATDDVLRGFTVDAAGSGIVGGALGTASTIVLPAVAAAGGPALDLTDGTANVDIDNISAAGTSTPGVVLDRVDGSTGPGGAITLGTVTSAGPVVVDDSGPLTTGQMTIAGAEGLQIAGSIADVTIDALDATAVTGTALLLDDVSAPPPANVSIATLRSTGSQVGIHVRGGSSDLVIGEAHVTDPVGNGLLVAGHDGTVTIGGGTIAAADPATFAGTLVEVLGGSGTVANAADVLLGQVADLPPQTPVGGRSVAVTQRTGSARFTQDGDVVDRGAGLRFTGNQSATEAVVTGAIDASTKGMPALRAGAGLLSATSSRNRLATADGTALRMVTTQIGPAGLLLQQVTSSNALFEEGSAERVGYGIDLVGVTPAGIGRLTIAGGQVTTPQLGGVRVTSSTDLSIGAVTVTDPSGDGGIQLTGTERVRLQGTTVTGSTGNGITSTDDTDLTLDGVRVTRSNGRGVHLLDAEGTARLLRTTIGASQGIQLHVEDTAADGSGAPGPKTTVRLESTVVSDTPAEVNGIQVDARRGSQMAFAVAGDLASASMGGRNAFAAFAAPGADLTVDLARLSAGDAEEDAILLQADAMGPSLVPEPTTLHFTVTDLVAAESAGIIQAARAGLHVKSLDAADVAGSVARAEFTSTGRYGVWIEESGPVGPSDVGEPNAITLSDVAVRAPAEVGIGIYNVAKPVVMDRLDVEGAPAGHAVELWGSDSVAVTNSRIDLRSLAEPEPHTGRGFGAVHEHCTTSGFADGLPPFIGELRADGVAGIYARHVGDLTLTGTTVRGATLHQVVVWNGDIPTIDDPAGRPVAEYGGDATTLTVADLLLLDSRDRRAGLFAGTTDGDPTKPGLHIVFQGGQTQSVGAHLLCAADEGFATVQGAPKLLVTTGEPALVLKAAGAGSGLFYDLDGTHITYADGTTAQPGTSAIQLIRESGGWLGGILTNTTITNAPGEGLRLDGVDDITLTGLVLDQPRGPGLVISNSSAVEVFDLTVDRPQGDGVQIVDSQNVAVIRSTVSSASAAGFAIDRSSLVSLVDATVTDPGTAAVDAATVDDLVVRNAVLTSDGLDPVDARPGVRVRNVLPLTLDGVRVGSFDDTAISVVNGSSYPGTTLPPLDCSAQPCAGALTLSNLAIGGTPADRPAVAVGVGPDVGVTLALAGTSTLDGPLAATTVAGGLQVTVGPSPLSVGGPSLAFVGNGDGLQLVSEPAAPYAAAPLGVDLIDAAVTLPQPGDPTVQPGTAIRVTGADTTALSGTAVSGAGQDGVLVQGGDLTVVGGSIRDIAGHGIVAGGDSLGAVDINSTVFARLGGDGVRVSDVASAAVRSATIDGATAGVVVQDVATVRLADLSLLGTRAEAARIVRATDVEIARTTVRAADGGAGIAVDGSGVPGSCVALVGNDVMSTAATFSLTAVGLPGYQQLPGSPTESVADWLVREPNNNVFAGGAVSSSDVTSC